MFGHYIGMGILVSMHLLFILWIVILSHYFDKNSTPKVLNPQISTFLKTISPKILYALMKTINELQRVTNKRKVL